FIFSLQEVHEILKEYELKYCFVDRNKGTDLFSPRLCNNPPPACHPHHKPSNEPSA
ncbi:hypothetical protein AMECASPLE_009847, partial [Ameca splendens]